MAKKETPAKETAQKHWEVDVRNIKPLERAGGNIRKDYGDKDGSFQELVDSIRANGVKVAIQAYRDVDNDGMWFSIDGHRRLKAAMKLVNEEGLTIRAKVISIPARTISDEQLIYDMVTTNTGKPLNPVELSEAVGILVSYKIPLKEIAQKFGKNTHFVSNLALFSKAPKRVRDLVAAGVIAYNTTLDILKKAKDFNEALAQIEQAISLARGEKKSKYVGHGKSLEEDALAEVENIDVRVTGRHINQVKNVVDSGKELQRVFRSLVGKMPDIKDQALYQFAKGITENRFTAKDIEKLLLN